MRIQTNRMHDSTLFWLLPTIMGEQAGHARDSMVHHPRRRQPGQRPQIQSRLAWPVKWAWAPGFDDFANQAAQLILRDAKFLRSGLDTEHFLHRLLVPGSADVRGI